MLLTVSHTIPEFTQSSRIHKSHNLLKTGSSCEEGSRLKVYIQTPVWLVTSLPLPEPHYEISKLRLLGGSDEITNLEITWTSALKYQWNVNLYTD